MMDKQATIDTIKEYGRDCDIFDCENCNNNQIEKCYYKSNNYCNDTFAEFIDYGGYDSAEEFWDNLLG